MNDGRGTMNQRQADLFPQFILHRSSFIVLLALCLCVSAVSVIHGQIETIDSASPPQLNWVSEAQVEGHLALNYSSAGAFSPDSSALAVVVEDKVVLIDLRAGGIRRTLRPRVEGVGDLTIHSASFLAPDRLFILGNGVFRTKGKGPAPPTPTIGFLWDPDRDVLFGKVNTLGAAGGFGPPRFFPMIGYVGLYKETNFDLWHPLTGKGGRLSVPSLTRRPRLFEFSPDGHWLLLAQYEGSGAADPTVVDAREGKFIDSLAGHQGTVLSMSFSRDNRRVLTTCEDGKVRVWSVPDWKLLHTLSGHSGPVHRAEFSADGQWIVSGGQDRSVRVWSASAGALLQTLSEGREPILSVAFSPNGEFLAASAEQMVRIWKLVRQ
jgi:WD40 repeat protein